MKIRWLKYSSLAIMALVLLVAVFLTLPPGEKVIRNLAQDILSEKLAREVKIGRLETNLMSRLVVEECVISGPEGGPDLVNLNYARLDYNILNLLINWQSFQSLDVKGLIVNISRDSSGAFNFPMTSQAQEHEESNRSAPPISLELGKIQFSDVSFSYKDKMTPIEGALHSLNFALTPSGPGVHILMTHADSGWVRFDNQLYPANDLSIAGEISPDIFDIGTLDLSMPGIRLSGSASLDFSKDPNPVDGDIRLVAHADELLLNYRGLFPSQIAAASGTVEVHADIAGTLEAPEALLQLGFDRLVLDDLSATNGRLKARLDMETLAIESLELGFFGGHISGAGNVALDSMANHQFEIELRSIKLSPLLTWIYGQEQPIRGSADGMLMTSGPVLLLDETELLARLALKRLSFQNTEIPDLSFNARYRNGLADLHIQQDSSMVRSNVRLSGDNITGSFSADLKHLEHLAGLINMPGLSGSIRASGDIKGQMPSPTIKAAISGSHIRYQNFPVDSLTARLYLEDDKIRIDEGFFAGQLPAIDTLSPPFDLEDFRGGFAYEGTISGPLLSPNAGITIELFNPQYQDLTFDAGFVSLQLDGRQALLKLFSLDKDSLSTRMTGQFSLATQKGQADVYFSTLSESRERPPEGSDLQDLDTAAEQANLISSRFTLSDSSDWDVAIKGSKLDLGRIIPMFMDQFDLNGMLDFDLQFEGSPENLSARLSVSLFDPIFTQVELDSVKGTFSLTGDRFHYAPIEFYKKGYRSWAEGEVVLKKNPDGTFGILSDSPMSGKAEGKDIDFRLFGSVMDSNPIRAGVANYQFEWDGLLAQPRIRGAIEISNGVIKLDENTTPIENISMMAVLQDTLLEVQRLSSSIAGAPLNLKGTIASHNWEQFQTRFNIGLRDTDAMHGTGIITADSLEFELGATSLNLSILQGFVPDLRAVSGYLNTEMKIVGPFTGPNLDGRLELRELGFDVPAFNTTLTSGTLKARFDQSNIRIDSLFAKLGDGSLSANGTLSLDAGNLVDGNMNARMSSISVNVPKEYLIKVESGQFSLQKKGPYFVLDGDLILGETRFLYHIRPQDILPFAQEVERPFQSPGELVNLIRMNIRIRETDKLWIDNNLARIRLHSEVAVIGNMTNPNFAGRISVEEGYLMYLDRKFLIKTGILDFVDPNRPNPHVDIKAEANIKSYQSLQQTPYKIILSINGIMDEAVIELTSEPPLEKPDIIALLTIGATREQLTGNNSTSGGASITDVIRDRLLVYSNQKVSGYTSRTLGNLLGLETMTIEGNLFGSNGAAGPQLLASKKISDRVEVTYSTTVGHANEQNVRLDYRLSRFFSLEGQTNQRGQPGMDLKFGIRFK